MKKLFIQNLLGDTTSWKALLGDGKTNIQKNERNEHVMNQGSFFQVFPTSCLLYHLLLPKQLPSEWLCTEAELLSLLDTIRSGQHSPQHRTWCLSRLPPPRYFLLATSSQDSAASVRRPIFLTFPAIHTTQRRAHFTSCRMQSEIPVGYSESMTIWLSFFWSRKGWERKRSKHTPQHQLYGKKQKILLAGLITQVMSPRYQTHQPTTTACPPLDQALLAALGTTGMPPPLSLSSSPVSQHHCLPPRRSAAPSPGSRSFGPAVPLGS